MTELQLFSVLKNYVCLAHVGLILTVKLILCDSLKPWFSFFLNFKWSINVKVVFLNIDINTFESFADKLVFCQLGVSVMK